MELPPLKDSKDKDKPSSQQSDQGISRGLKIGIIIFTVFTFLAFILFAVLIAGKLSSPKSKPDVWDTQLLTVAEKLKDAGLPRQAIEQYEIFLQNRNVNMVVRGEVSRALGNLYKELSNCREALSWYYQAEAAFPKAPWLEEMDSEIDGCLHDIKPKG